MTSRPHTTAPSWLLCRRTGNVPVGSTKRHRVCQLSLAAATLLVAIACFAAFGGSARAIPMPPSTQSTYLPNTDATVQWRFYADGFLASPPGDVWVLRVNVGQGLQNSYLDTSTCPPPPQTWQWPDWCYGLGKQQADRARATIGPASGMPGLHVLAGGGLPCQSLYGYDYYCYRRLLPASLVYTPPERTYGSCGNGIHAVNPSGCQSDPVIGAIGAFVTEVTDASLPGIGLPFVFTRTYTSADSTVGPIGPGWTHSFAASLNINSATGNIVLRGEDGQQVGYTPLADGSYVSDPGARSTLTKLADGYKLVRHDQVTYRFDTDGKLLTIRDRNDQGPTLSYSGGLPTTITDSAGRTITLSYTNGLLTQLSLPGGRSVGYVYTNGRLTSVTDLRGGTIGYRYDAGGRLDKITDQNGHAQVENIYGANGRVVEQIDARGGHTTFSWDPATETETVTNARGKVWKDVYSFNVLMKRIDPLNDTTTYAYDTDLNAASVTDPRGKVTTSTYDSRGNLLTRTAPAPLSYQESFTYNARNDPLTHVDRRGNTTSYAYDAAGNLTSVTRPGSVVTQFGRDPGGTGLLTSVTDPRGKTTSFDYDSSGDVTKITTPLGFETTMAYDASGRMTSLVEPRGNLSGATASDYRSTFTYDAADELLSQTDPLGHVIRYGYDAVGNRRTATDANNHITGYAYDAGDQLTAVTAPDNTVTSYSYDAAANLASQTDANNHVTGYAYDDANRLLSVTSPLGHQWSYVYDENGNVTKFITARGNATPEPSDGSMAYAYDVLNRLASIDYSDATPDVQFSYDGNGNRLSMSDGAGTVSYVYDSLDRLTSTSRGADTFSYAYNPSGDVTGRTYPDGTAHTNTYDNDGRLGSVASGGATTSYTYDAAAHLITTTLPAGNGYAETSTYDRAGRLIQVTNAKSGTTLSQSTYTLDPVGNPTTVVTNAGTRAFTYDPLDRLTSACFAASCTAPSASLISWTYDPVGNRTSENRLTGTTSYAYNAGDELISQSGLTSTSYTYDADGNQTAAGSRSFSYDLANRLVSTMLALATTTYLYDGDGIRLQASSGLLGLQTTKYLWDRNNALPELALERDAGNALVRRYVYGNDRVSMTSPSGNSYYHYDGLGSVINVTSAAGLTEWTYDYEPWGGARTEQIGTPTAPANLMRFVGELYDTDTGLYHLRARQYDATTGRFLAVDPIERGLGRAHISSYVYADDSPTTLTDPSGLTAQQTNTCGSIWCFIKSGEAAKSLTGWGTGCERSTRCLLSVEGNVVSSIFPWGRAVRALAAVRRFRPDQEALIQLAKDAKRRGGLTADEGSILKEWAGEYRLAARGPEAHPRRGFGSSPHYHIGPVNHIPAR